MTGLTAQEEYLARKMKRSQPTKDQLRVIKMCLVDKQLWNFRAARWTVITDKFEDWHRKNKDDIMDMAGACTKGDLSDVIKQIAESDYEAAADLLEKVSGHKPI